MTQWHNKATELANCNCDYGCPCQFNALPTHGNCEAVVGFQFHEGKFGDVDLSGLRAAGVYWWPGPVHGGDGKMQLIIDEKASDAQREALLAIMSGEHTDDMATMWWIYNAMCPNKHEPLFKPIDLEIDVENRTGRISVPGVFETSAEPIRNAVTGAVSRSRIDLPHGFEYELAEMGSGTSEATGEIKLKFDKSYGQFAHIHLSNKGVVRSAA